MSRNTRLALVGVGAFLVAAVLDFAAAGLVTLVAMSGPDTAPDDCNDIGCALSTDEFGAVISIFVWILALGAVTIGAVLISLAVTLIGVLSQWQPRPATGTFAAIGLGILAAALGPLIAILIGRITTVWG